MGANLEALLRESLYVCYMTRRLRGETAWSLADEFSGEAVAFEIRYQVEQAAAVAEWESWFLNKTVMEADAEALAERGSK